MGANFVMSVASQMRRSCIPWIPRPHRGPKHPPGHDVVDGGVNFSLFSRTATAVELLLFDREDDAQSVPRDPDRS